MLTLYLDVIRWGLVRYYSSWQAGKSFMAYLQNIWVLFSISFPILYLVHDRYLLKGNTTLFLIPITTYHNCYRDCNNAFPSPTTKWYRLACFLHLHIIYWLRELTLLKYGTASPRWQLSMGTSNQLGPMRKAGLSQSSSQILTFVFTDWHLSSTMVRWNIDLFVGMW